MSVSNIQSNVQSAEQYRIRKQTEAEKLNDGLQGQVQQTAQEVPQVDEYDKANPVGEEAEGIYSVSHDEEGNLKVNYVQPGAKSETSKGGAATAATSKTDGNSDSEDDEELEQLKRQRDSIKKQLNSETDEEAKKALRVRLQAIEMQIAMKSSSSNQS